MSKILSDKNFLAGALFLIAGLCFLGVALGYSPGTARQMGPGYFPSLLAGLLSLVGLVVMGRGLIDRSAPVIRIPLLRPSLVLVSIAAFAILIDRIGLVVTVMVSMIIASLAASPFRLVETLVLAAGLAVFCALLFGLGLHLPVQIGPF
ncbi:tripartite tricarboxylate transporter TctB family protein [Pseudochelatococcus sp. B33]